MNGVFDSKENIWREVSHFIIRIVIKNSHRITIDPIDFTNQYRDREQ